MIQEATKKDLVSRLQKEILAAEGLQRLAYEPKSGIGLQVLEAAFPDHTFPRGGIHEFISPDTECAAATTGFITAVVGRLARQKGPCIWISRHTKVFAPALAAFGLPADQVIFIHPDKDKDLLWTTEQALKCTGIAAVIADVQELDLTASRRLQLAVEQSRVTGLLHRHQPRIMGNTACVARWQIQPLRSEEAGLPGMGYPRWKVDLLKVRAGRPGSWVIDWVDGQFRIATQKVNRDVTKEIYIYSNIA
jgi:protein ImuA